MNAKQTNESHRKLFMSGGRLDILLFGDQEIDRQMDEASNERQAVIKFGKCLELPEEHLCPCGCGLKNDVCADRQALIKCRNAEMPF